MDYTEESAREFQRRALQLLEAHVNQRPGLEPGNYISHGADHDGRRAYFSEQRRITRQLHDARRLLAACSWRTFTPAEIIDAFRAFSGRLTLELDAEGQPHRLGYCTGQYWPTEYRAAACAVLGSLLFRRAVDNFRETGNAVQKDRPGDFARDTLKKEFGYRLQQTWMD